MRLVRSMTRRQEVCIVIRIEVLIITALCWVVLAILYFTVIRGW